MSSNPASKPANRLGPVFFLNFLLALAGLALLWFLLSGHNEAFFLFLGGFSCLISLLVVARMLRLVPEPMSLAVNWQILVYLPWLLKEIVKANFVVARAVLSHPMKISPHFLTIPARQKTDVGHMIFGNSITLTPGTVTVETYADHFLVHALNAQTGNPAGLAEMDRRVAALEANT
jgi:multicomponent Na+:H+ antiporter subunit E